LRSSVIQHLNPDIVSLNETHLKANETIEVPGYTWFGHNRHGTHVHAVKGSGGVGFLVKHDMFTKYNIQILDKSYEGIIWIKCTDKFTDAEILLCSAYLPPEYSVWGRNSELFFDSMLNMIYRHADVDFVLICGDLNSRTGNMSDIIENVDQLIPRSNVDNVVNQHGKALIEFLHESCYCILNGRKGPMSDHSTYMSTRGSSVVDYFLIPQQLFNNCTSLSIQSSTELVDYYNLHNLLSTNCKIPDHAVLSMELMTNSIIFQADSIPIDVIDEKHCRFPVKYNVKHVGPTFLQSDRTRRIMTDIINEMELNLNMQQQINNMYDKCAILS
jgi:exonuclease III